MRKGLNVLFFGSCEFSIASLQALVQNAKQSSTRIRRIEVVTPPEQVPIKAFAQEQRLRIHNAPPKSLKNWKVPKGDFDLGVVVSFGYFLPKRVIQSFEHIVNVHPSLLPLYRGASPIQYAIRNGDEESGISIIELHEEKFDHDFLTWRQILGKEGGYRLLQVIENLEYYKQNSQRQPEGQFPKAPKITKQEALIDWSKHSSQTLFQLHQAISHQFKLWTLLKQQPIFITKIVLPSLMEKEFEVLTMKYSFLNNPAIPPGSLFYNKITGTSWVKCQNDWIGIKSFQMPNKQEISGWHLIQHYGHLSSELLPSFFTSSIL